MLKFYCPVLENGQVVDLFSNPHAALATSIAVSGSDVYVADWDTDASFSSRAKFWENGVTQKPFRAIYRYRAKQGAAIGRRCVCGGKRR